MTGQTMRLDEVDATAVEQVGGKGANLGELARMAGVTVPDGFCVTTEAFREVVGGAPEVAALLGRLAGRRAEDQAAIAELGAAVRAAVAALAVPDALAAAVGREVERLGTDAGFAVRSSAAAEDSAGASFAGLQDSYLDVPAAAVLDHVRRCWASAFTDRALAYRLRNGHDVRAVDMAVVVQRMVAPDAAGVMFTADPVNGNRTVVSIEAVAGLGEALVSGRVTPEVVTVRDGVVGRDETEPQVLTDAQAVALAALGRRIEAHHGRPQDIEWCLAGGAISVVQSRPITTLYPVPVIDDDEPHVYVSVGHQQMMTDAMRPLGLSLWQMTAGRPMHAAGGRLFVDVAGDLAAPAARARVVEGLGTSDPLIGDALRALIEREGFLRELADDDPSVPAGPPVATDPIPNDPAIVAELIAATETELEGVRRALEGLSGVELMDAVAADVDARKRFLFAPRSYQAIMASMEAAAWLNEHLLEWLGERNVADVLTQSSPDNVTSEMGLALIDVADAVRPSPEVVAFLERVEAEAPAGDAFLDELEALDGGAQARAAIDAFLARHGMRCVGEIDLTRPRWAEQPAALVPPILANVRNFTAGAAARRFEQGRAEAERKAAEVLERLRELPDGEAKATETAYNIERVRTYSGYREYPKYGIVCRTFLHKRALMQEARALAAAGVVEDAEDVFLLHFDEFREAVRTHAVEPGLVARRRVEFAADEALTPPRVMTSEGEVVTGSYRRDDVPAGALVGLPVSAGTVEGRARVVHDVADAELEPGDILVTTFTDPSWTPLFVAISGLVTEVGGLMTHGAVIAREYGLPAVVGVEGATREIHDGERIRLHGTDGYVERLG